MNDCEAPTNKQSLALNNRLVQIQASTLNDCEAATYNQSLAPNSRQVHIESETHLIDKNSIYLKYIFFMFPCLNNF